ncbi:MAG: DUF1667 domain-containing protein [Gemmiger sp.]|uniref:DUF1667 domain-containing protein n=1 Tax=Gemmiger sp. TaxID=2049027 RepID=UPI002E763003|nr:DUF1667 domain-containing protein [Gemmiger sp.]MEE0800187.1 DUF1667 domain-containing protein [Gemmiger sp.]
MRELVCICCPKGCRLSVDEQADYAVTGNSCPRGAEYGREECRNPTRVVTSTVAVSGGIYPRCPVKTEAPVPKRQIFAVMAALDGLVVPAPVALGQKIVRNAAGTGVDIVATRNLGKKTER